MTIRRAIFAAIAVFSLTSGIIAILTITRISDGGYGGSAGASGLATLVHRYEKEINGSATLDKSFRPLGVAVNQSTGSSAGDVYVAYPEGGVVDKFGPHSELLEELTGFSLPDGVAIDNSLGLSAEGVLFVADRGNGNIYKGKSVFVSGLVGANSVAVNQATGEVYVTRAASEEAAARALVYRFASSGKQLSSFGFASSGKQLSSFEGFAEVRAVAVNNTCYYQDLTGSACTSQDPSNEDVYVLDETNRVVDKLEPSGKLLQLPLAGILGRGVAVNQSNGHVYVAGEQERAGSTEGVVEEFSSSGALLGTISEHSPKYPEGARDAKFAPGSVAVDNATGDVYVGDIGVNDVVDVFGHDLESPQAFTGEFLDLRSTSVTLDGEVNPKGNDATSFFEYGPCAGAVCSPGEPFVSKAATVQSADGPFPGSPDDGSGTANVPVQASVTGLSTIPNYAYHYRLLAENAEIGESPPGEEGEFRTLAVPPLAESLPPTLVGFQAAVLSGSVDPQNSETTYRFEYAAGQKTLAERCPEGSQKEKSHCEEEGVASTPAQTSTIYGSVSVFQEIEGLLPSSVYHYRLVAENQACPQGRVPPCPILGSDVTLTTEPAPPLSVTSAGTIGVTQTTAVISGSINPNGLASNYGFQIGTQAGVYGPEVGTGRIELGLYEPRTVTLALQNLKPGTTYHYRLLASNTYTTIYGTDETFTTTAAPVAFTQPLAPPLLAIPPVAFPTEAKPVMVKALTRAQQLSRALKACGKKPKRQRPSCERNARKKYRAKPKSKKK